jgi:uncharacterized protein (TIGR00299 family) protein
MKIAYFDTVSGVSGDMTLGAFISAGVPFDELLRELTKLHLVGVELVPSHIQRNGITATKLDVIISAPQKHHRHLNDILAIIGNSSLSGSVKENARKIFLEVAKAEAKVHDKKIEQVHFHEVGALDSIVDIVGAAICFEILGIEKTYSSPVKLGHGGFVQTEHGQLPVPTPATMEILKGYPTVLTDIPFELTTPTGAAIIKAMSSGVLAAEDFTATAIGYGAGTRELPSIPNVLRIVIGEMPPSYREDVAVTLETNIDDMNPELYPYVIERLLEAGALDAYLTPVIMKKGRPGILLSVLTAENNVENALAVLFSQTSTIGVRIVRTQRKKLDREARVVTTKLGAVKVKAVVHEGKTRLIPEFEECRRLAGEKNLPLLEVYRILEAELQG